MARDAAIQLNIPAALLLMALFAGCQGSDPADGEPPDETDGEWAMNAKPRLFTGDDGTCRLFTSRGVERHLGGAAVGEDLVGDGLASWTIGPLENHGSSIVMQDGAAYSGVLRDVWRSDANEAALVAEVPAGDVVWTMASSGRGAVALVDTDPCDGYLCGHATRLTFIDAGAPDKAAPATDVFVDENTHHQQLIEVEGKLVIATHGGLLIEDGDEWLSVPVTDAGGAPGTPTVAVNGSEMVVNAGGGKFLRGSLDDLQPMTSSGIGDQDVYSITLTTTGALAVVTGPNGNPTNRTVYLHDPVGGTWEAQPTAGFVADIVGSCGADLFVAGRDDQGTLEDGDDSLFIARLDEGEWVTEFSWP